MGSLLRRGFGSVVALLALAGCPTLDVGHGPPIDSLYFPTGIAHLDVGGDAGSLVVANANFDKRYATGSIDVIALDDVGLPPLGTATGDVLALRPLGMKETQSVQIASFAGELAVLPVNGGHRIYVPTRSEGMRVYQTLLNVDAAGRPQLSCIGGGSGQDCREAGPTLVPREFESSSTGLPRAPSPYGVAVAPRACTVTSECCPTEAVCGRNCVSGLCRDFQDQPFADVWFTHLTQADTPLLSSANLRGYVVRLDSDDFTTYESSFIDMGSGASNSIALRGPWAFVSGRAASPAPNLVRLVSRGGVTLSSSLESYFRVSDARSIVLSTDRTRLYLVGRAPDTLLVLKITDPDSVAPGLSLVRGVALPDAPNQALVISRPGAGDLVAVSCTSGSSVALYDDDVGDLVALIPGVGSQPYGLAVDHQGAGARLFVTNFGDGRVGVIDIPDLARPRDSRLVAHLGMQQVCLTRGKSSPACQALGESP